MAPVSGTYVLDFIVLCTQRNRWKPICRCVTAENENEALNDCVSALRSTVTGKPSKCFLSVE